MAKVRQMPELYLRGSLANITMANLTETQKHHVDGILDLVADHPDMHPHKVKVMKKFGVTIAADYADDRLSAEQEYRIAIWRGIVNLFYHRHYTFTCKACNQSHYTTKRMKAKAIDRISTPCPNCQRVQVDEPGDAEGLTKGQYVTIEEFQEAYKDMPDGWKAPTYVSSITYIPGELRYPEPNKIMDDPKQLQKFFGEFVWNYFRQQIKENKREEHRTKRQIQAPADFVILQDIISLCIRMGVEHNYCAKTGAVDGRYTIKITGLYTPPEFTVELALVRKRADLYRIQLEFDATGITVHVNPKAPQIQTVILHPELVSILDSLVSGDEEHDSGFAISQVSYRSVRTEHGVQRMDQENHVEAYDCSEAYNLVRQSLPDGHCRDVFDILSQQGEKYVAFSEIYGDGDARMNHIAEFLGITPRAVGQYKQVIEHHCLANDLMP